MQILVSFLIDFLNWIDSMCWMDAQATHTIFEKLYKKDKKQLVNDIVETYQNDGFCVINFVYMSPMVEFQLFISDKKKRQRNLKYQEILLKSQFLLPDGIALQTFYKAANKESLYNLNWTDFTPYFLEQLAEKHKWVISESNGDVDGVGLICYGTNPENLEEACYYLGSLKYDIVYAQDWFSEFDWKDCEKSMKNSDKNIFVMLQGRSSIKNPIQELWTLDNRERIRENKLIVMNVWGLFDWRSWEQKRPPEFIRKIKMEWFWRLCTNPKRNFKKVLNTLKAGFYLVKLPFLKCE